MMTDGIDVVFPNPEPVTVTETPPAVADVAGVTDETAGPMLGQEN